MSYTKLGNYAEGVCESEGEGKDKRRPSRYKAFSWTRFNFKVLWTLPAIICSIRWRETNDDTKWRPARTSGASLAQKMKLLHGSYFFSFTPSVPPDVGYYCPLVPLRFRIFKYDVKSCKIESTPAAVTTDEEFATVYVCLSDVIKETHVCIYKKIGFFI